MRCSRLSRKVWRGDERLIVCGSARKLDAGSSLLRYVASMGEATTLWHPQVAARLARRSTCCFTEGARPMAGRSLSVRLVVTVSAKTLGPGNGVAAATAARKRAAPAGAWTVTMDTPSLPAAWTAPAAEFGISWSLRSRKSCFPLTLRARCQPWFAMETPLPGVRPYEFANPDLLIATAR